MLSRFQGMKLPRLVPRWKHREIGRDLGSVQCSSDYWQERNPRLRQGESRRTSISFRLIALSGSQLGRSRRCCRRMEGALEVVIR
jgi:hypothetical protein